METLALRSRNKVSVLTILERTTLLKHTYLQFIIIIVILSSSFLLYLFIEKKERIKTKEVILSLFKDSSLMGDFQTITKQISYLEKVNFINCVTLMNSTTNSIFYNSKNKDCPQTAFKTEFSSINNQPWIIYFNINSLNFMRLTFILATILAIIISLYIIEVQKKRSKKAEIALKASDIEKKYLKRVYKQVGHDISSPLTAITTISQLNLDPNIKQILKTAADRVETLVKELKSGVTEDLPQTVDLKLIIHKIIKEKQLIHKNIIFHKKISDRSLFIFFPEKTLERILSNILNNSIEAGCTNIFIETAYKDKHILLKITDNGKGIPLEVLNSITHEGYSYQKPNGSGLGLFHAKTMLSKYTAYLNINSKNRVTTVSVKFKNLD